MYVCMYVCMHINDVCLFLINYLAYCESINLGQLEGKAKSDVL